MLTIPPLYRPPHGVPLYWRDETSGVLAAAVNAYLNHRIDGAAVTDEQLRLVKAFFVHYIHAPCWEQPGAGTDYDAALARLRRQALSITTPEQAARFIEGCLDLGLDPL